MDMLLCSVIGFSLLVAIQVSFGVESTNNHQQFILFNQVPPSKKSDDSVWIALLLILIGSLGVMYLMNQF